MFEEDADWDRFQAALLRLAIDSDFELLGFCLMQNHAHMLIRCGSTPLGNLLRGILSSHAQYFNKKYGKSGHMFQGRFKAVISRSDEVLKHQLRYIHCNPLRCGLVDSPEKWRWSSHAAYGGNPMPGVDTRFILGMFADEPGKAQEAYLAFMADHPYGKNRGTTTSLASVAAQMERDAGFDPGVIQGPIRVSLAAKLRREFILRTAKRYPTEQIAEFLRRSESYVTRTIRGGSEFSSEGV